MTAPDRRAATHLAFPVRVGDRGRTATATDEQHLRNLIEMVLFTRPGERVNRPEFGSGAAALVFAPAGDELAEAGRALVHGALQDALSDLVRIDDVTVEVHDATLSVTVVYTPLRPVRGGPSFVAQFNNAAPGGGP